MICYKDMTFCSSKCAELNCHRNFTDEVHEAARKWWGHDPDNVPVAFSDFSTRCEYYKPKD